MAERRLDDLESCISPISDIIEDAREGRMFILVDAEDRENEGDLVIPAQFATPAAVNFMAKHGRGLICLALTPERGAALGLEPMTWRNMTKNKTAFTVSIEAKSGVTTGISAHDRSHTIAVAIDPTKDRGDIVSPGHIFPLIAQNGGVLVRAGHTEASVDVARIAGLVPASVICEIMSDDGSMARLPELAAFAQTHNLKIGTIADLIAYRRLHDQSVERVREHEFIMQGATGFHAHLFRSRLDGVEHLALVKGEIARDQPILVRMHRVEVMADILKGGRRAGMVDHALRLIEEEGSGVLVLLRDVMPDALSRRFGGWEVEGADHMSSLFKSTAARPSDDEHELRVIGVGAQILRQLGVGKMIVLSNTAQKLVGIKGYGLEVEGFRPLTETGDA